MLFTLKEEKMRKVLAMMLAAVLALSLLTACTGSTEPAKTDDKTETTTKATEADTEKAETEKAETEGQKEDTTAEASEPADVPVIKVSYPCLVVTPSPDAVVDVEKTINERLDTLGAGVHMQLEAIDGMNYATQVDMEQIGGEKVDLYMALGNLSDMVASNKVTDISDYRDVLKPVTDITGDTFLDATQFDGKLYGVPCYKGSVLTYYWVVPTEIAEDDLGLKVGDRVTVEDITGYLATMHEKYPDKIAMGVRPGANGSANQFCLSAIFAGPRNYSVTGLLSAGVGASTIGIVGDDLTVVDLYDTDYFKKVCETAYEWNQAGYVNKDASVATEEGYDLMKADRCLSYLIGYGGCDPKITDADTDTTHGRSVMMIPVDQNLNMPTGLDWCVSYGCENPEAAVKALTYFYTDPIVMNTLLYGVEGRDWVNTGFNDDPLDPIIQRPEGLDAMTVPYNAQFTCGIMGNEFIDWVVADEKGEYEDLRAAHLEFMQSAPNSPVFGFSFNTANVKNQIAAISNVEAKYMGGLLTGEMNPDEYIPQLVAELEQAGIKDVIDECQTQLDAWAKENK